MLDLVSIQCSAEWRTVDRMRTDVESGGILGRRFLAAGESILLLPFISKTLIAFERLANQTYGLEYTEMVQRGSMLLPNWSLCN